MSETPTLNLGAWRQLDGAEGGNALRIPARHVVTHSVVLGMTGSGKPGCVTVLVEEALRAGVPTIIIDVKGDLPNLLLTYPSFDPALLRPSVEGSSDNGPSSGITQLATQRSEERQKALAAVSMGEPELQKFSDGISVRVITPGASAGESLHVLSALERRSSRWDTDPESARNALSAAVSLVLRLLGRDPDPAKSREHVLLSVLAERRLAAGQNADIAALMQDLTNPPITEIGALAVNSFLKKRERYNLAAALNTLLASPTFCSWRKGASLDIVEWVAPRNGRTPAVVVSVAHLDEEERTLVLGVVLEEILSWVRTLPGSERLKALVVFDEVYGFLPPHPANPPTKRPIVALMKQARAFGVGVVVATQNPMDLDYRALSNAGLWCIGRLQTDADRARVLDGLAGASRNNGKSEIDLSHIVQLLAPRWFIVKNAHAASVGPVLLRPRDTLSLMRGPMTRNEILQAKQWRAQLEGVELPPNSVARPPVLVEVPESVRKPRRYGFVDAKAEI
jgi:DNA helicase HerA-like ATPase